MKLTKSQALILISILEDVFDDFREVEYQKENIEELEELYQQLQDYKYTSSTFTD